MTGRAALVVALGALVVAGAAGCGKKGNPLPPLRPVPMRIADLTVVRTPGQMELRFTVPATNLDGSVPVAIDRVDVYAITGEGTEAPPSAGALVSDPQRVIRRVPVRRPGPDGVEPATAARSQPAPGEVTTQVVPLDDASLAATLFVTAVPVAGTGNGRSGPPSAIVAVPLDPLPPPPTNVVLQVAETGVQLSWTPARAGDAFRVVRLPADPAAVPDVLTRDALQSPSLTLPVVFDQELCLAVRAVRLAGPVSAEGALSDAVCATPVDRYPPPVPSGLRAVQEGTAVTLLWDPVVADDLAGYVVLRGGATETALVPLFRDPIAATTYRDTTAVAGTTYIYAVYAVDRSQAANVSALSDRETITIR